MGFHDPDKPGGELDALLYEYSGLGNTPNINVGAYPYVYVQLVLSPDYSAMDGGTFTLIWEWRERDTNGGYFTDSEMYVAEFQDIWAQNFVTFLRHTDHRKVIYPYLQMRTLWANNAGILVSGQNYKVNIWGMRSGDKPKLLTVTPVGSDYFADGTLLAFDQTFPIGTTRLLLPPYVGRAHLQTIRAVSGTITEVNGLSLARNISSVAPTAYVNRWLALAGMGAGYYPSQYVHLGPHRNFLQIDMSVAGRVIGSLREAPE